MRSFPFRKRRLRHDSRLAFDRREPRLPLGGNGAFSAGVGIRGTFAGTVTIRGTAIGSWIFEGDVAKSSFTGGTGDRFYVDRFATGSLITGRYVTVVPNLQTQPAPGPMPPQQF